TYQPVEVIHDDAAYGIRFREPQIDSDAAPPIVAWVARAPIGDAPAVRAKMKANVLPPAGVGAGGARHANALIFVVVGPPHAVAREARAVAGRSRCRHPVESPASRAALTRPFDHSVALRFMLFLLGCRRARA